MFVLSECTSLVRLPPRNLNKSLPDAITEELNRKIANKVLHNVGLCISLWDILEIGDSFLFPGDGAAHSRVKFRLLNFHPFGEEVLTGKIVRCSPEGVQVSLGFFEDILIPPEGLQHPSRFDEADQVWVWQYPAGEPDGASHDLYMDQGEEIRFRVAEQVFTDTSPTAPETPDSVNNIQNPAEEVKKIPYMIHGTVNEPGLGLVSWWNN